MAATPEGVPVLAPLAELSCPASESLPLRPESSQDAAVQRLLRSGRRKPEEYHRRPGRLGRTSSPLDL